MADHISNVTPPSTPPHPRPDPWTRACVIVGAERFPWLTPQAGEDLRGTLERYVCDLHGELAQANSYGMGLLSLREVRNFPEMRDAIERGHLDYLICAACRLPAAPCYGRRKGR